MHFGNYYKDVILFIYFSNEVGNGRNCSALLNDIILLDRRASRLWRRFIHGKMKW